jgi:polo-like kinase 1
MMQSGNNPNLQSVQSISKKEKVNNFMSSELHVKKWVDYSTKYGLGYLLSDGSTGVYFNDSTKIILDAKGEYSLLWRRNLDYIEKKPNEKVDTVSTYSLENYPKEREFQKKVTLLLHFRNYLYADSKIEQKSEDEKPREGPLCYVKKWMKTRHAIMFRLSNKIVQVNFTDKTEIILSSEQKLVTYVNIKGEKSEYPLATALDSRNVEMAKR